MKRHLDVKDSVINNGLTEIVKFDPSNGHGKNNKAHYCQICGISDDITPISENGYCKYHQKRHNEDLYNYFSY